MTSNECRTRANDASIVIVGLPPPLDYRDCLLLSVLWEIAAQLADLNESLRNGMITIEVKQP